MHNECKNDDNGTHRDNSITTTTVMLIAMPIWARDLETIHLRNPSDTSSYRTRGLPRCATALTLCFAFKLQFVAATSFRVRLKSAMNCDSW